MWGRNGFVLLRLEGEREVTLEEIFKCSEILVFPSLWGQRGSCKKVRILLTLLLHIGKYR